MNNYSVMRRAKRIITIAIVCCVIFVLTTPPVSGNETFDSYIVQGTNINEITSAIQHQGGTITSELDIIHGVSALIPRDAIAQLLTNDSISSITPNGQVEVAKKFTDPPTPDTEYPDVVGADVTWEDGVNGEGITVAVIDTGLGKHPGIFKNVDGRIRRRIIGWVDFVERRRSPSDPNGHGTHITGIIANSEVGTDEEWNGVAPGVRIVAVRVLDQTGYGTYEQVIKGVQWVVENKNKYDIKVMNLSLVSLVQSPYWADPLNQAITRAWAEGITVIVAAGNEGSGPMTITSPGNNPYVVTVGAFTDNYTPNDWNDDYVTPFSSAGPTLDGFVKPDVVAPGAHIVSTMMPWSYLAKNHEANRVGPTYFSMAGTSQSTGVVSGIAALILANNPELTPNEVKYRLMYPSFPWVDTETTEALYSIWQQGAGRVNAYDAVFGDIEGEANYGMDIWADLDGDSHYEGFSYYDETTSEFRLRGDFSDWAGGYGNWAGGYGNWAGGYGNWAGGYGNWAGGYGNWAGGYGNWAGGYGNWAGGYGNWAGGYGNWAGGYGNWAGGYGNWAGGYGNWAGSYGSAEFAELFVNWSNQVISLGDAIRWNGTWLGFDG